MTETTVERTQVTAPALDDPVSSERGERMTQLMMPLPH